MPDALRVCMVSDDFVPAATGVGVHLKLVTPELVRRGHDVTVITTRRPGQPEEDDWQGVRVLRMPTLKVFDFYQALPSAHVLRGVLTARQPHVVHHHYLGLMMRRAAAVALQLGLAQVSTYHFGAEILTQPWPLRPLRRWVEREIVRVNNICDLVISPSANLIGQLAALGIHKPIRHVSNPVAFGDLTGVQPVSRSADFMVMYAGRLGFEKNIGLLIRAFAALVVDRPNALLWIAGSGPELAMLQRLCETLNIQRQVRFLGFLSHEALAGYYAACDVFVLPSLREVQPLVAMEAMWFGKPVILTRALAVAAELVDSEGNGFIVHPDDPGELTQRLLQLADQSDLRVAMGRKGRERAELFRPGVAVDALEKAYRDVVH